MVSYYANVNGTQTAQNTVLILIVVEDGLVQYETRLYTKSLLGVLILIVVEDGLVLLLKWNVMKEIKYVLILIVVEDGLVPENK